MEPAPQTYTLKLEGDLKNAAVWSADGKDQLDQSSNTETDINGNKTITLNESEIIIKVANETLPRGHL